MFVHGQSKSSVSRQFLIVTVPDAAAPAVADPVISMQLPVDVM
jgi:hypothetical protein